MTETTETTTRASTTKATPKTAPSMSTAPPAQVAASARRRLWASAPWLVHGVVLLLLALAIALGVGIGTVPIAPGRVVRIFAAAAHLIAPGDIATWESQVVLRARLPRVLVATMVGAALSVSGATLQSVFRNPLADPGVLGVSAGAALGAVVSIYFGLVERWMWFMPLLSCVGAATAMVLVWIAALRVGRATLGALLLSGIAVSNLALALMSLVLSLSLRDWEAGRKIMAWLMGSLEARTWDHWTVAFGPVIVAGAVLFAHSRELDALSLGEVHATAVGVDVAAARRRIILAASVLTGVAVSVSGVIVFVGLIIPHSVRLLVGPKHGRLLPLSATVGATFLVLSDVVARRAASPEELRLGVVTSLVGAPIFLLLLLRRGVKDGTP